MAALDRSKSFPRSTELPTKPLSANRSLQPTKSEPRHIHPNIAGSIDFYHATYLSIEATGVARRSKPHRLALVIVHLEATKFRSGGVEDAKRVGEIALSNLLDSFTDSSC